jgi:hypothetical protein
MTKKLILSLSKANGDFILETFSGSGAGGQNRNRKQKCVRLKHPASGVTVIATEERSLEQNKKCAFQRLINNEKFKQWHKIAIAEKSNAYDNLNENKTIELKSEDLKIEYLENGQWIEKNE